MADWRVAGSLVVLRDQVNAFAPNRSKVSDGTIGDAAHAAVASDHNPNAKGVVCALDITHDPTGGLDAHALADRLLAVRHPDLKYLISNRRIAGDWTDWKWTSYSGTSDPHINHIHVSVGRGDDGQSTPPYDDTNKWNVTGENEMSWPMTKDDVYWVYHSAAGQDASPNEIKAYVGKPYDVSQAEIQKYFVEKGLDFYTYRKNAEKQIADLQAQLAAAQKNPVNKEAVINYLESNLS